MSVGTTNFQTPSLPAGLPTYQQAQGQLQNVFGQQYADLYTQYQAAQSQGLAGINASGLGGTTIAPSARMGYFSQYTQAQNRLASAQAQAQIGLGVQYNQLGQSEQGIQQAEQGIQQGEQQLNLGQQGVAQGWAGLGQSQQQISQQGNYQNAQLALAAQQNAGYQSAQQSSGWNGGPNPGTEDMFSSPLMQSSDTSLF